MSGKYILIVHIFKDQAQLAVDVIVIAVIVKIVVFQELLFGERYECCCFFTFEPLLFFSSEACFRI